MKHQLQYIDRWLDKVQESMKELQLVPGTTPKGKGIIRNQNLSQKQLWVGQQRDDIDLAPMVKITSDRDINHTPPKSSPYLNPSRWRPNESSGQVESSQDPTLNVFWASVTNQEYRETKEASDKICADALHCSQLWNKEQGNTLEQRVDEVIRWREQKTKTNKSHILMTMNQQCGWTTRVWRVQWTMAIMLNTIIWPYVIEVHIHHNQTQVMMMTQLLPRMIAMVSVEIHIVCTVVGYVRRKATYCNTAKNCW